MACKHRGLFMLYCFATPNVTCHRGDKHLPHAPCAASATLRDVLKPEDQVWLRERFRLAAHNRYLHLAEACDANTACDGTYGFAVMHSAMPNTSC